MRTTLTLTPEAFVVAKAKAAHENLSLGDAVSRLILQSLRDEHPPVDVQLADGVFRSDGGTYSSQQVEEAIDDE